MKTNTHYYCWQGINHQGIKLKGVIEATSVALVKKELGNRAIVVKKIRRKQNSLFLVKITAANITLFFRQLATMIKAGIPLIQSFDFVANSQTNFLLKYLIEEIKSDVEHGLSFSEALEKRPQFFNGLVCNLIAAGEKSGKLDLMLTKVSDYKENIEYLKRKLKKALAYPLLVLIIACFVTLALLIFVVPQFELLFRSFDAELPALTRVIIYLSTLFKTFWPIILFVILASIFAFKFARKRLSWLSYASDKMMLKIPILGSLLLKAIIARFARTLALSFAAGLSLSEALGAVAGVTGNQVYAEATEQIKLALFTGEQIHTAMKNTELFPNMVIQMVAIGEESGTLELMLNKIAECYEEEVKTSLDLSINLLEPIIMSLLGLIIGSLVIAMYLPIFKLGSVV
ncbi:MAG: type II secretion system F family protein [Tatlockia sp.]|nr:type II secretion system F family protein [Tatlockia sp.]